MPDEGLLDLARLAIHALLAAIAALATFLLAQRLIVSALYQRADRQRAALTPRLFNALEHPELIPTIRLSRSDRRIARGLLLRLAMDLRGEIADAAVTLYTHLGLLAADRRKLRAVRWAPRARAAARLGTLRAEAALPDLRVTLSDPDPHVRQIAVWAVGQMGDREALALLVPLLGDPDAAVAGRTEEILAERGREVEDLVLARAERPTARGGLAAIELLGLLRAGSAVPLLARLMENGDAEVRVKAVKAGAAIGDPRLLDSFHSHLSDAQWPVRCQAAKALSVLSSPSSLPYLETALRDPEWWVRFYAATALAELGSDGENALVAALDDPTPAVADMARYLLSRGVLVPVLP